MRKNVVLLLLFIVTPVLRAQNVTQMKIAGRDVALWKPSGPAPESGYPLIVFSHRLSGCNTQSVFLMEALAKAGYLVLASNHADARCGSARQGEGSWYPGKYLGRRGNRRPEEPFRADEKWTDATYRDRARDIKIVLDTVLCERLFQGIPFMRNVSALPVTPWVGTRPLAWPGPGLRGRTADSRPFWRYRPSAARTFRKATWDI